MRKRRESDGGQEEEGMSSYIYVVGEGGDYFGAEGEEGMNSYCMCIGDIMLTYLSRHIVYLA